MYLFVGVLAILLVVFVMWPVDERVVLMDDIRTRKLRTVRWTLKGRTEVLTFLPSTEVRIPRDGRNHRHMILLRYFTMGTKEIKSEMYDIRNFHGHVYLKRQ